jgi:nucleoside-diphosphate-sugar epimerase
LVSDGEDLSLSDLLRYIAQTDHRGLRLIPLPQTCQRLIGRLSSALAQRLLASLVVDISHTRQLLAWQPPFSVRQGLAKTV